MMIVRESGVTADYINELSGIVLALYVNKGIVSSNGSPCLFADIEPLQTYTQRYPDIDPAKKGTRRIERINGLIDECNSLIEQGCEEPEKYHSLAGRIVFWTTGQYRNSFQKDTLRYEFNNK